MKIAFRNFLTTLRRYKISSLLNVIGLTLAFTAFYVIMTQVWWELGYNRSLHEADRIYLVENEDWYEPGKWSSWLNRPVPERVIASTAGVEVGGCMWGGFGSGTCWTSNEPSFGYNKFSASCGSVSLPFLDVFAFRSVEGDVHDIGKPKSVIVSREAAERMRVGVGSLIWVDTDEPQPDGAMEVVAVFEDFPDNSLLGECEVVKNLGETNLYTTSEWSFNYFVKFRPGADPDEFARQWTNVNQEMQREAAEKRAAAGDAADDDDESGIYGVRLSPVSDLYFESDSQAPCRQGSVVTTYTLLGIAVLVIVLAFINFVNFFFALVPVRIRTVNTFKVFGAPASSLRFNFVFEAFGLVLIALLAAWYVSFALQGTEFASYISASLALSQNLEVVGLVAVVAFVMALAASLYPAWYITSFAPALVVKGSFGGTRSGRRLRTLLLGVQFFISIGLIIATSFIRLQHDYMMHYDMGFDKENLLAVRLSERGAVSYDALRQKLLSDPQVKDVTGATSRLVSVGRMGWGREFKGRQVAFQSYVVQPDFLRVMGIPITDGRDFLESDFDKELGTMIFNEAARREFEMQVGDRINGFVSPDEQIDRFLCRFQLQAPAIRCIALLFLSSSEENPAGKLLAPASCGLCADDARSRYCGCYRPYPPLYRGGRSPHGAGRYRRPCFRRGAGPRVRQRTQTDGHRRAVRAVGRRDRPDGRLRAGAVRDTAPPPRNRRAPGNGGFAGRNPRHVQPPLRHAGRRVFRAGRPGKHLGRQALARRLRLCRAAVLVGLCPGTGGGAGRHGTHRHRPLVACR